MVSGAAPPVPTPGASAAVPPAAAPESAAQESASAGLAAPASGKETSAKKGWCEMERLSSKKRRSMGCCGAAAPRSTRFWARLERAWSAHIAWPIGDLGVSCASSRRPLDAYAMLAHRAILVLIAPLAPRSPREGETKQVTGLSQPCARVGPG